MKKVLFVAHVDSHIRHFHIPYLKYFKENGYEVHVATSNDEDEIFPYCDVKHPISFERSPFKLNNIKAIKQMKNLFKEENFDIVHCHTPMGGVITRLACKNARKNGTKILYTAHGFHFYKGAPFINWCVYYPIEKFLSRYTDGLITVNHEDYELAKKKFHAKKVFLIPGVGVDNKKFNDIPLEENEKLNLMKELKIQDNDFVMMYVAEINKNKNQIMLINAMQEILKKESHIKLFLVGSGELLECYKTKTKEMNLENNVFFLGYRNDTNKLLKLADLYVATSMREGLPINLVEAELSGVPVIAKSNRGHNEIIKDDENGYIFNTKNELIEKFFSLYSNKDLFNKLKKNARSSVNDFILDNAYKEQEKIYDSILNDDL